MQMQPDFEKANEIYFRLGIIYKQQAKFGQSLEVCLMTRDYTTQHPLTETTVLQIYCTFSSATLDRGGYLVPNRTCS